MIKYVDVHLWTIGWMKSVAYACKSSTELSWLNLPLVMSNSLNGFCHVLLCVFPLLDCVTFVLSLSKRNNENNAAIVRNVGYSSIRLRFKNPWAESPNNISKSCLGDIHASLIICAAGMDNVHNADTAHHLALWYLACFSKHDLPGLHIAYSYSMIWMNKENMDTPWSEDNLGHVTHVLIRIIQYGN